MSTTEKITINMSVVDLGKIDLLIQEGFYANRTDFIRNAIRRQLALHEKETQQVVERHSAGLGIFHCSSQSLKKALAEGKRVNFRIAGMLVIDKDVTSELAEQTIDSINIWGVLRASNEIKQVLADRIH